MNRYRNVDWKRLYKVLVVHSANVLRRYGAPGTIDGGLDCEDVAGEVLAEFVASPDGLGWKEAKGQLTTFLCRIAYNKAVEHLRRQKHVAGSLDDEIGPSASIERRTASAVAPQRAGIGLKEALYELVRGDTALEDLIEATELISGAHNVNQELADILGKTPRQVSKLKERLLQIEGVKELYAARQINKQRA